MEPITIGLGLLTLAAIWALDKLLSLWGPVELPPTEDVTFTASDKEKILASRTLIKQCFGDNVVDSFRTASNFERIRITKNFAESLAHEYGLNNVNIDVIVDEANKFGYYNHEQRKAVFNINLIASANNQDFDYCVRQTIDTIVHELRHAIQHHAIDNPDFWNIDNETLILWCNNMKNYIRPEVDFEGYANQPIEKDASHFAAEVMRGLS